MHDQPDQEQRDRYEEEELVVLFPFSSGRARLKPKRQRQTEQTPAADAHRQPNVIRRQVEDKAKHAKPLNQLTGLLAQMAAKASISEMTCPALDTVSLEERNMQRMRSRAGKAQGQRGSPADCGCAQRSLLRMRHCPRTPSASDARP